MAKLIAHGPDRDAALSIMAQALGELEATGVHTNAVLLAELIRHERFVRGDVTTKWLEEALA